MISKLQYIGIDVSQDFFDVYAIPCNKYHRFSNDTDGIKKCLSFLDTLKVNRVCCEATGKLEQAIARTLTDHGYMVDVVNPNRISAYRQCISVNAKTDILDAKLIADFAMRMLKEHRPMANAYIEELRELGMRRRQCVDIRVQEKNRLKRCKHRLVTKDIKNSIAILDKRIAEFERLIKQLIKEHLELKQKFLILKSVPGIGDVVAMQLICDLPELGKLSKGEIAALVGVAPMNQDSGKRTNRTKIRGGRKHIRSALYMAAMAARRSNSHLKVFYENLVSNGKKRMVALVALMRKIIIIANQMLHDNKKFVYK